MRLSFKREPRQTGLSSIANPNPGVLIKANGLQCGMIYGPSHANNCAKWSVSMMVEKIPTLDAPAAWRWSRIHQQFETEQEARNWITLKWPSLVKWDLYLMPND